MDRAISETDRRRAAQLAFNTAHGIEPRTIVKGVSDIAELLGISGTVPYKERRKTARGEEMSAEEIERLMVTLEEEMFQAAEELRFEYAAKLRDEVKDLARDLARLKGGSGSGTAGTAATGRAAGSEAPGAAASGGQAAARGGGAGSASHRSGRRGRAGS
jgi:excinuclease ABC subunit B